MSDRTALDTWLDRWEELQEEGRPCTVDEFIARQMAGVPNALIVAFRAKVARLRKADALLDAAAPSTTRSRSGDTAGSAKHSFSFAQGEEPVPGYHLVKQLGSGGFGEVWKATAPGGLPVALKFVRLGHRVGDTERHALTIMKEVRHPNLLAVVGSWETHGHLVIAMELADKTLLQRLKEVKADGMPGIPRDELFGHLADAARGLDYLHKPRIFPGETKPVGIQHRDVKPHNLLLSGGGVKVGDFGLVRILKRAMTAHSGSMTYAYAAPEFFADLTSSQSDQYSLAVTYCELRGGRLPFTGNAAQLMKAHLDQQPDLSMLPAEERAIVRRALAKKPAERWPSCAVFVEALRNTVKTKATAAVGRDSRAASAVSDRPVTKASTAAPRSTKAVTPESLPKREPAEMKAVSSAKPLERDCAKSPTAKLGPTPASNRKRVKVLVGLSLCGLAIAILGWKYFNGGAIAERPSETHAGGSEPAANKPGVATASLTTASRPTDTRSLILEAGKGFPINCYTATVGKLETKSGGTILPVTIRVDPERYKQFDQRMRPILERVAKGSKRYAFEPRNLTDNPPPIFDYAGFGIPGGVPLYSNLNDYIIKTHYGEDLYGDGQRNAAKFQELGTFGVMLFDDAEPNLRRMRWTVYDLDQALLPAFDSCQNRGIQVTVRLFDEGKREIAERTRSGRFPCRQDLKENPEPGFLLGIGRSSEERELVTANINPVIPGAFIPDYRDSWYHRKERDGKLAIYPIGPFFYYNFFSNGAGGFSPEIRFAMPFNLSADEVEKVKSVECQLSFLNGDTIF